MQEHPVPQNVTGYEFHLIGQMTLKQFVEVAIGVVIAVLIYWTNLPVVFKYPLMVIAGLLGLALAFVPLGGRPLDRWFFAFIKSIYQPTMFFWKKTDTTPPVFMYSPPKNMDITPTVDYTPMRQSRLQEYVHTVALQEPAIQDEESKAADEVLKLFTDSAMPITASVDALQVAKVAPIQMTTEKEASPPKAEISVPNTPIQSLEKDGVTPDLIAKKDIASIPVEGQLHAVSSTISQQNTDTLVPTESLAGFPFPNKPTNPNMLAGMVVNTENKIVEGAIITIIRQSDNTPVRAIKTNTLGEFAIVTPLESGSYVMLTEKDGLRFDKYSLVLNNQVVEPIIVRAR